DDQNPDILILNMQPGWTWEEFHTAVDQAVTLAQTVSYPVYAVSIPGVGFPSVSGILNHFKKVLNQLPANMVLVVIVTDNYFIETVNRIFFRVAPSAAAIGRIARSLDDARQIIAEHRAKQDIAS